MEFLFLIIVLALINNDKLQIYIQSQHKALKKTKFSLSSDLQTWSREGKLYIQLYHFKDVKKKIYNSIHHPILTKQEKSQEKFGFWETSHSIFFLRNVSHLHRWE